MNGLVPQVTASPTVFDRYALRKVQAIVATRKNDQAEINLKFMNGDHWQEGAGWVGPSATAAGAEVNNLTLTAIKQFFVSHNVVAELTNRHVAGVLGRELHWAFTVKRPLAMKEVTDPETEQVTMEKESPTPEEQALIDEAEAVMTEWWDKREAPEILQTLLEAALNAKRGVLRLFVPPGMRDENGNLPTLELAECLNYIWLQHLGSNEDTLDLQFPSATVYTDKHSRRQVGIFVYDEVPEEQADDDGLLVLGPDEAITTQQRAELTYLDGNGDTVLRVINNLGNVEDPVTLPLGGRLLMYEMTRRWLITPQIVSQQKQLNMTKTMKGRNAVQGGFLERTFFNVQWPGKTDPNTGDFVPTPLRVGPGFMTSLQGVVAEGEEGKQIPLNPSVTYKDPVSPQTFIDTEESDYIAMLQEGNQLHYALSGDGRVSEESRKQAREAFRQDLQYSAGKVAATGRWVLETVLALAAYFAGRGGEFEGLRAYVQPRIDSGPVSPDDMRVAKEMKEAEIWDLETAQSATGVEDVDAVNQRIQKERVERQKQEAQALAAAQKLMDEMNPPTDSGDGSPSKQPAAATT